MIRPQQGRYKAAYGPRKGSNPPEISKPVRDPDFQPERCGHRARNGRKASMSNSQFPERVSLEYLKKLSKDRLRELRLTDQEATLAEAQLSVARDYGFSSWRALKAEVERRRTGDIAPFFEACANGDVETLRGTLA